MSFTSLEAVSIQRHTDNRWSIDVSISPLGVAGAVLVMVALFVSSMGLDSLGLEIPLVQPIVGFVLLSFVPGALLLKTLDVTPNRPGAFFVFSVGVSMSLVMVWGLVTNFTLWFVGVPTPVSKWPMGLSMCVLLGGLAWAYTKRVEDPVVIAADLDRYLSPSWLALALLPFLAIYGALALTVLDSNHLLLVLYASIAVIPILVVFDRVPESAFPIAIWVISVSLLLQNTLTGNFLAWGDQPKEAALALHVLNQGVWQPAAAPGFGNKYAMVRIVLLHPIYALVTDLSLTWVFKLVHPLLFSVTPTVLYYFYRRYVDGKTAFLASFLYVSLFSYFIVLSRNTRTATAILFLALFALALKSDSLSLSQSKLLTILFALSIVVSHYGVSYMVMAVLPVAIVVTALLDRVYGIETTRRTSVSFVGLYLSGLFAWYIYAAANSKSYNTLVGFTANFLARLRSHLLSAEASASTRILTETWQSSTLQTIKYYNVLVGALIGIGMLYVLVSRYRSDGEHTFDNESLAYAGLFLALFGVTFLPVERFNTARTYATTLVFFAPFFVFGVVAIARGAQKVVSFDTTKTAQRVAAVVVVMYFLLNAGFVSAVVTHEYSTNVLVEKPRVMTDGRPTEAEYFYKQYPTVYGGDSTEWVQTHAPVNATVYSSNWPGNPTVPFGYERQYPTSERVPLKIQPFDSAETLDEGYIYLGPYSHLGGVISLPGDHFEFNWMRTEKLSSTWENRSRVFDNGGSVIYR